MTSFVRASLVTVTVLFSATACSLIRGHGEGAPLYSITTNRDIYSRGNTGEATIRNVSTRSLEYNLCQRRLERQANKYWVVAFEWPTAGGVCTTELRRLPENEEVRALFDIPTGVPIGTYRLVFTGLRGKDGRSVSGDAASTRSFTVR
jgi:hypothetical protein